MVIAYISWRSDYRYLYVAVHGSTDIGICNGLWSSQCLLRDIRWWVIERTPKFTILHELKAIRCGDGFRNTNDGPAMFRGTCY